MPFASARAYGASVDGEVEGDGEGEGEVEGEGATSVTVSGRIPSTTTAGGIGGVVAAATAAPPAIANAHSKTRVVQRSTPRMIAMVGAAPTSAPESGVQ
jgi:hypothetical protein